jgi:hypothetical protein
MKYNHNFYAVIGVQKRIIEQEREIYVNKLQQR